MTPHYYYYYYYLSFYLLFSRSSYLCFGAVARHELSVLYGSDYLFTFIFGFGFCDWFVVS